MSLLSEITFGSFLIYSSHGTSPGSLRSKFVCRQVKSDSYLYYGNPPQVGQAISLIVQSLKANVAGSPLDAFFTDDSILVPAPKSSLVKPDTIIPTRTICNTLIKAGFGKETQSILQRTIAVPKAAFVPASERPTVPTHFKSLSVVGEHSLFWKKIIVVDDVVTKGNMLLASVSKLKEIFPDAEIKGFALLRTMSSDEVSDMKSPCIGAITLHGEDARRRP